MSKKKKESLTEFELEFIEQYFINGSNATKAYMKTSEKVKKKQVKYDSAKANGHKYKKKLEKEIKKRQEELRLKDGKVIDTILYILKNALTYDISNVATIKNNELFIKDTKDWTILDKLAINTVEPGRTGIKVEFIDKKWAMSTLLKIYYGMINENTTEAGAMSTGFENKTDDEIMKYIEEMYKREEEEKKNE